VRRIEAWRLFTGLSTGFFTHETPRLFLPARVGAVVLAGVLRPQVWLQRAADGGNRDAASALGRMKTLPVGD